MYIVIILSHDIDCLQVIVNKSCHNCLLIIIFVNDCVIFDDKYDSYYSLYNTNTL